MRGVRQFRTRLDRIIKSLAAAPSKKGRTFFPIDLGVAKKIRDDLNRLNALQMLQVPYHKDHRPLTAVEIEEIRSLHERMQANIATIDCPAEYGLKESREDTQRLRGMAYLGPTNEVED